LITVWGSPGDLAFKTVVHMLSMISMMSLEASLPLSFEDKEELNL